MSASNRFVVRYCLHADSWQELPLAEGQTTLGRDPDCTLHLVEPGVSRHHARLTLTPHGLWLTDLGSTYGTQIDGRPLPPRRETPLLPGQTFTIGQFTLVVERAAAASSPASAPSPATLTLRWKNNEQTFTFDLSAHALRLGRLADNDIVVPIPTVSARHARIESAADGQIVVRDLGSTNGLLRGGRRVSACALAPGEKVNIGVDVELEYSVPVDLTVLRVMAPSPVAASVSVSETVVGTAPLGPGAWARSLNLADHEQATFGRAPDNHVVLDHPLVSRYHAVVERMGTRYRLRDLRSVNGVFVNGERIGAEIWLKERDEVRIGPYAFHLTSTALQARPEPGLQLDAIGLNRRISRRANLLQDISLSIHPQEFIAIVGMSGAGKTTLLDALSGYRPATHGQMLAHGMSLYRHYDLFRNDIGYVPQRDIVHGELTPESALDYAARLRMPPDTATAERRRRVKEVLDDLGLTECKDTLIAKLSGGQVKRVSIGVELLTKPRLFYLDEPTSGLDPGTEFEMMKLLRRLADQGRTVILVTHATKNVMLCDKVIFMAPGGYLAYFGPPEAALAYFDAHRTPRERREKEIEFDDIYRILGDDSRGSPADWAGRFRASPGYAEATPAAVAPRPGPPPPKAVKQHSPISSLRQFAILSARNLRILYQDKVSLALMLAVAPLLSAEDFVWGRQMLDPVAGNAVNVMKMWFLTSVTAVLVGTVSSVREIVKETAIYKRERAVGLRVLPYVLSKVWVGLVLAVYQAIVILAFRAFFVDLGLPTAQSYLALFVTLILGILSGYLLGLAISAAAPSQNAAMFIMVGVFVPQLLFGGALLPLDPIPGGEQISIGMPTRWIFEGFVRATGLGDPLAADACWALPKAERLGLTAAAKAGCTCMGANLFARCGNFPGLLSPDFFGDDARRALAQAQPVEPPQPTAYPSPTPLPSPTSLPTPTPLPTAEPPPVPANPAQFRAYLATAQAQGNTYREATTAQFEEYRRAGKAQGDEYGDALQAQGDEYATRRLAQFDDYAEAMRAYGDERAAWEASREKAIRSAEGLLGSLYDNYHRAFRGSLLSRWGALIAIMSGLLILVVVFQRRKDAV
ncbi:MAG: FHA domain-containing protein [Chloroflexi bacterium]|nr:FHA domain-containing protein [Chloroflexota bacterium]